MGKEQTESHQHVPSTLGQELHVHLPNSQFADISVCISCFGVKEVPHLHLVKLPLFRSLNRIMLKVKVVQSCPTLCDPMGYTVHGILQARILEWVALPFSSGSSQPRDQIQVSHIAGGFFASWVTHQGSLDWIMLDIHKLIKQLSKCI